MAASFDDRAYHQPNFGVNGTIPDLVRRWQDRQQELQSLPSWTNPDIPWKFEPPPSDWRPLPPPPPSDGPSPFDQLPSPVRPGSQAPQPQDVGRRELLNWILGMLGANGGAQGLRRRSSDMAAGGNDDLIDRRPNALLPPDPNANYSMRPRFDSNQAAALQKLRPQDLTRLLGSKSNRRRSIQPPIFFPID